LAIYCRLLFKLLKQLTFVSTRAIMHFSVVVLLPLLCRHVLADQVPLKDMVSAWFDKAKAYVPGSHPIETAAAVITDKRVERINLRNWEGKLAPKLDTEEEWMIYVTGGNKSCFGRCGPVDVTWNVSALLAVKDQCLMLPS
jgi:hypothetical protein